MWGREGISSYYLGYLTLVFLCDLLVEVIYEVAYNFLFLRLGFAVFVLWLLVFI